MVRIINLAGKSKDSTTSNNFVELLRSDITTSPSSSVSQEQNTVLPYQKYITQNGAELLTIEAHVLQLVNRHMRALENDVQRFFKDIKERTFE